MRRMSFLIISIIILSLVLIKPANSELSSDFEEILFDEETGEEPLISLDFKDASLKDVLKVFSMQAGLNFIASEDIQDKKITLYLEGVPLSKAMEKIFEANNLTYKFDEKAKIYIVKPPPTPPPVEPITKVYFLKYVTVGSSSLVKEMRSYLEEEKGGSIGESVGITEAIRKVLSDKGKVVEEPQTNSLIVTDFPKQFPLVEEVIKRLDTPIVQVILEVEMLDVNKNKLERMGIKFGDINDFPSVLAMTITGAQRGTKFPFSALWPKPEDDISTPRSEVTEAGKISFANSYQVLLDLIKSYSDTKILARPRILTLNNRTAEIKVVSNEAVNEEVTFDEKGNIVGRDYERIEVGVSLRITPQVNLEEREITMFIIPKVSNTKISGISSVVLDPEERTTKSLVRVKDGETVILGGLIHNDFNKINTKVPLLGDIPVIGALFRHKEVKRNKERELLVFITPRIVMDKKLAKLTEIPVPEEEKGFYVFQQKDELRYKTIGNFLNNFEKAK
ncbi:MAG: hypothetical protein NC826_00515 [Candidatus Omnitrophica bacterium]|nr:hypothetical protein [Candidatus Omnitrophota bacterium]